jgi:hypothetical protein
MTEDPADATIRQAIGGDADAIAWITREAATTDAAALLVAAALLEQDGSHLERADLVASSRRDRQAVAIARSHLQGRDDLVDALARDHLVDYPDSLLVAWIASGAALPVPRADGV